MAYLPPENSDNTLRPRPIQTRVATALLALFLTFQLCPQPREWPRPMLRKVPIGRRSDWGMKINNAGFGKGLRPGWHTAGRCWPRASRAQLHDQHLLGAVPKVPRAVVGVPRSLSDRCRVRASMKEAATEHT